MHLLCEICTDLKLQQLIAMVNGPSLARTIQLLYPQVLAFDDDDDDDDDNDYA